MFRSATFIRLMGKKMSFGAGYELKFERRSGIKEMVVGGRLYECIKLHFNRFYA